MQERISIFTTQSSLLLYIYIVRQEKLITNRVKLLHKLNQSCLEVRTNVSKCYLKCSVNPKYSLGLKPAVMLLFSKNPILEHFLLKNQMWILVVFFSRQWLTWFLNIAAFLFIFKIKLIKHDVHQCLLYFWTNTGFFFLSFFLNFSESLYLDAES